MHLVSRLPATPYTLPPRVHVQALASGLRAQGAHGPGAGSPHVPGAHLLFSVMVATLGDRPVVVAVPPSVLPPSDVALFTKRVPGLSLGDGELGVMATATDHAGPLASVLGRHMRAAVWRDEALSEVRCM